MSAETELSSMLSHATSNTSSLAASSANLVDTAINVLASTVEFPNPPNQPAKDIDAAGWNHPDWPPLGERESPIGFPQWPEIEFSELPELVILEQTGISQYYGIGAGPATLPEFPELSLPTFDYPALPRLERFQKTVPEISTEISLPDAPNVNLPHSPRWLSFRPITTPTLNLTLPTFASVDTAITVDDSLYQDALTNFNSAIFNGSAEIPGLDSLLQELTDWLDKLLNALLNPVLSILNTRFSDTTAAILGFHDDIQARLTERLTTEQNRVISVATENRSGWDLPSLVQQALLATTQQLSRSWVRHAQSQVDTKIEELKLEFFEFCGSLYESLQKAIITAKTKEIEYVLEAHKLSIAYAKQSIKNLLSLYNIENFTRQDFFFKEAEAKLQLFEANLKLAMTRYEFSKAKLSVEKVRQDQDALEIKQYQQEMDAANLDVQMYASQVGSLRTELALKKLPFEVFEAKVKAFDAQIDGHTALVGARIAELEGDSAKVDGEKAKAKAYLAEVRGFEKTVQTKRETINTQIQRNEAVIAQYEAEIRAYFAPIEQSLLLNEYELKKYTVLAEDYLADARVAAESSRVELEFLQKEQEGLMNAFQATQERGVELMNFELKRLDAIAEINAKGSAIMADMAGGAMSAANGIASLVFREET